MHEAFREEAQDGPSVSAWPYRGGDLTWQAGAVMLYHTHLCPTRCIPNRFFPELFSDLILAAHLALGRAPNIRGAVFLSVRCFRNVQDNKSDKGRCHPYEEARKGLLFCPGSEYQSSRPASNLGSQVNGVIGVPLGIPALEKS